jgi:hypothetical protein
VGQTGTDRRSDLVKQVAELASQVIFGSLSEMYRTCGTPGCRCHTTGPKHGPQLQVVYKGDNGKTTGYYVPIAAQSDIRRGVAAWREIQDAIRELAKLNRDEILERARSQRSARGPRRPATRGEHRQATLPGLAPRS